MKSGMPIAIILRCRGSAEGCGVSNCKTIIEPQNMIGKINTNISVSVDVSVSASARRSASACGCWAQT
jgi:hypothetical protein